MILGRGSGVSATSTHTKSSNSLPRPLEHRTASAVATFVFATSAFVDSAVASAVASARRALAAATAWIGMSQLTVHVKCMLPKRKKWSY